MHGVQKVNFIRNNIADFRAKKYFLFHKKALLTFGKLNCENCLNCNHYSLIEIILTETCDNEYFLHLGVISNEVEDCIFLGRFFCNI